MAKRRRSNPDRSIRHARRMGAVPASPAARPTSAFLAARATTASPVAGGISLRSLKEAMKRAIDVDSTLMKATGDSYIESTISAHIETLAQELKVLEAIIAANLFPSPESIEGSLGRDFVNDLAASISELEGLTASDANFSALLAVGVRLSAAVERLRGAA
jgi:hypothetical protein